MKLRSAILAVLLGIGSAAIVFGQRPVQRIILKDGSYQPVTKYEVKGERVRYLSAERNEWEEVPNSLVDWDATNKFNEGRTSTADSPEARALDKEYEAELKAEEARSPQVAPGLNLPPDGGIFLLDTYRNEQQLVELVQNGGDINHNTASNILRGAINPIASSKQSIQLSGKAAAVQAHVTRPTIYFNPQPDTADTPAQPQQPMDSQRFKIVRAEVKKDVRIVGNIKIAVYGKVSQQQKFVDTIVEPVSGGWFKLTPAKELTPGEYAVVEMLGKEGMNLYVWDFGVNPRAPANPSAWKPVPGKQPKQEPKSSLEKRN